MRERIRRIKGIITHKRAFKRVEKELLGRNTKRAITHDLDKLLMFIFLWFIPVKMIRRIHKKFAQHHNEYNYYGSKGYDIYVEAIIDMECARFTKRNSTLTALEFIEMKYDNKEINTKEYNYFIKTAYGIGLEE